MISFGSSAVIYSRCLSGFCHHCRAADWSIEVSYECIWSFLILLIEAVASGQLEEIFVLSGITDLWVVFCRFVWV